MLASTACSNLRTLPGWRYAVIVHAPNRAADAHRARLLLEEDGWRVNVVPEGAATRENSSLAVYDAKKFPKMAAHLSDVLAPMGTQDDPPKIDVLPFLPAGSGGTSAVLWLAE